MKTFRYFYLIEIIDNDLRVKNRLKRLGKGYSLAYRLNPFHPVAYIVFIFLIILLLISSIFEVFKKFENPFKYN